jgi:S-adenosylmethionine synthetase
MTAKRGHLILTSESVTEGHPDKICDQISDAILDYCLEQTPTARVACESAIKSDANVHWAAVFGETTPHIDKGTAIELVRKTLREIGYTDISYGTDADAIQIEVLLSDQSCDIAQGVDEALEAREGDLDDDLDTGAGDQGMMFGYASDESAEFMPLPIILSHKIARRLAEVRKSGQIPWLRPDGKTQCSVDYQDGVPTGVGTIVVSTQHAPEIESKEIYDAVLEEVIRPVVPVELLDDATRFFINPTGRFVIGGPYGDAGLTGRKIIVDTYGGIGRHGGGAFSGKDPTKVDRSGAYAARWVAKSVVAGGLAKRCEVQIAYAIGVARPVSIAVETFGTERVDPEKIADAIDEIFDLRPAAIIRALDLCRPIYRQTAAYGHFGRTDLGVPWESTDRAAALASAAGL